MFSNLRLQPASEYFMAKLVISTIAEAAIHLEEDDSAGTTAPKATPEKAS